MEEELINVIEKVKNNRLYVSLLSFFENNISDLKKFENKENAEQKELREAIEFLTKNDLIVAKEGNFKDTKRGKLVLEYSIKDWNPSKPSTKRGQTFEILSDGEWHCSACELPSSQPAKDIQQIRIQGFKFEGSPSMWGEYLYCENCDSKTVHRKMKHTFPTEKPIVRAQMPRSFKTRVRKLYNHKDAFDGSTPSTTVEVDHRKPEVRWDESEDIDFDNITDKEIKEKFQVLSRKNNLLKSRKCEQCVKTGERPPFMGIEFWYKGDSTYNEDIGCEGCGWYNPQKWKEALNLIVEESDE